MSVALGVALGAVECISIALVGKKLWFHGYSDQNVQLQETTGALVFISKCDRDRWIGAAVVPARGANEYATADTKNYVVGRRFAEMVTSDNEPAVIAMKEAAATALKLTGLIVKIEERALCVSQSDGLAESAVKEVKHAVRTNWAL